MSALVLAQPPQDYAESGHEKALLASGPMLFPNCPHVTEPPPAKAPLDNAPKHINANPAATLFVFIMAFQKNLSIQQVRFVYLYTSCTPRLARLLSR